MLSFASSSVAVSFKGLLYLSLEQNACKFILHLLTARFVHQRSLFLSPVLQIISSQDLS